MNVKKMYNEVIVTSLALNFFDSLLSSAAAFAVGYFLAFFFKLPITVAYVAAGAFFLFALIRRIRQNKILKLEESYPALHERLRTSYDHQSASNSVINDLHADIMGLMQKVDVSAFLSGKGIALRIFVICILLFSTLYLSSVGTDFFSIVAAAKNSQAYKMAKTFSMDLFDEEREEVKNREMLDSPSLINKGTQDMNISIDTFNTELDSTDIKDPEKNDYGGHFPQEIAGAAQETYDEKIPEEYKESVKDYFKKIR
ncbi:MAG: hypothetical protein HGA85_08045 [Nanoarchaeota archaeon]|nr:hypothetical protein [Nanoarchaeota archaeon]